MSNTNKKVNFEFVEPGAADKIYFESVTMEIPGGALVNNPTTADLAPTTPLAKNSTTGHYYAAGDDDDVVALLGSWVYKDKGDQPAKIVLGGVVRATNAVDTDATLDGSVKYV